MRKQGFTLPELLIALSVAATLTFLAIPLIGDLVARQRVHNSLSNLTDSLKFARTYAVLHQTGVTLLAQQNNWGAGWTVFEDPNQNAKHDHGERSLLSRTPSNTLLIRGNITVSSYVHFNIFGEPQLTNGGFQAGTMTLCSPSAPSSSYKLVMAKTGRVRISESNSAASCP